jgi:hypothetical protein
MARYVEGNRKKRGRKETGAKRRGQRQKKLSSNNKQ